MSYTTNYTSNNKPSSNPPHPPHDTNQDNNNNHNPTQLVHTRHPVLEELHRSDLLEEVQHQFDTQRNNINSLNSFSSLGLSNPINSLATFNSFHHEQRAFNFDERDLPTDVEQLLNFNQGHPPSQNFIWSLDEPEESRLGPLCQAAVALPLKPITLSLESKNDNLETEDKLDTLEAILDLNKKPASGSRMKTRSSGKRKKSELESTKKLQKKAKRAYYRKDKHSKQFLERINKERLVRKRQKNRELAAKSREKKKQKLLFLQKQNQELKALLNDREECGRCASCPCCRQFNRLEYPDSPAEEEVGENGEEVEE